MILLANSEGGPGVATTAALLRQGGAALDAIEAGVRLVEADRSVRSVGVGSWPNIVGELELDAAVMDGATRRTGAVGALLGFLHPISVARRVMDGLPHELLVGEGAARYAREIGAEPIPAGSDPVVEERWRRVLALAGLAPQDMAAGDRALADLVRLAADPERIRDTTVYLARDAGGNLCSGASTSGWAWKYPGRLGDTPIIGAGSYADARFGAAACTNTGEMTIRAGTARAIVRSLELGLSLDDAVAAAVEDLRRLEGGQIGTVTIHAVDVQENHKVVCYRPTREAHYWLWSDGMAAPEQRLAGIA